MSSNIIWLKMELNIPVRHLTGHEQMDWWKIFNKSLKKAIRVATIERKNWKEELYNFLSNYRATPHTTTDVHRQSFYLAELFKRSCRK